MSRRCLAVGLFLLVAALAWGADPYLELRQSAEEGDLARVTAMLEAWPDGARALDANKYSILHYAALRGRDDVVGLLAGKGADVNLSQGPMGTPLHMAAREGHRLVAETLLARGANVMPKDDLGETPLHLAAQQGYVRTVELLIAKKALVNARDNMQATPLHYAARFGQVRVVRALLDGGADLNAPSDAKATPLHEAAASHQADVVALLLAKGASANVADAEGRTPLHYALRAGDTATAEKLVAGGADVSAVDKDGSSPLRLARGAGREALVRLLRLHGAKDDTVYIGTDMPAPVLLEGETQVPLRYLAEWLDGKSSYNTQTRRYAITIGERTITGKVGNIQATVDGEIIDLKDPIVISGGETYMPLSFLADYLNTKFVWDPKALTVALTHPTSGEGLRFAVGDPTDPNPVQSAALAARGVHPVVAGAGHFLLGGMANGKMAGADELYKKLGRGDEFAFKLYGLTGYLGTTTGRGAMYPSDAESFLPPMTSGRGVIAIAGTWNAMPRTPKSINVADGNFNAPVRDALIEKGLHAPTINLTQVLKIDLENDGPEEYLITAWSPNRGLDGKAASEVRADDYSVVLLRKMVGGRWITYALAFDCYPKAVPGATPTVYRVATVADVDGDGAQEVIVEPQGAGEVAAFRVRNGQLEKVMGGAFAEVGAF